MLERREGTDLYILCGRKEIAVHLAIVWPQSHRLKDLSVIKKDQYGVSHLHCGALGLVMSFAEAAVRRL